METFRCSRCESLLPADAFSWNNRDSRSGKRYRYSQCKKCTVEKVREWRAANPEKYAEQSKRGHELVRSDPERKARERARENALRRAKTRRGEHVKDVCKRCGSDYEYDFVTRRRDLCDLCRKHNFDWTKYRLTGPEAAQLRAQEQCSICGCRENPGGRFNKFHIDHCHGTGKVRGLLCAKCNTVLGLMDHDPERLRTAAAYLEL